MLEDDLSEIASGSPLFFWLRSCSFLFLHLFQFGFVSPVWLCKALCASPFMYPYWCILILLNFAECCLILSTPSLAFLICDVVASYQRKHCQWFMQVHSYVGLQSDTILCSVQRFWWGVCYSWMIVLCIWGFSPSWPFFLLSGWSSLILDLWDLIGVGPCRQAIGSPCWVFFQSLFEYFGSVKPMGGMVYPIMTSWLHLCHHLVVEVLWNLAIIGLYCELYTWLK